MINNEVLEKKETQRNFIFNIRNREFKFKGHIMTKRGFRKFTLTGYNEIKKDREMQRINCLICYCKWLEERIRTDSKKRKLTKSFKRQESVQSLNPLIREGTRHKEKQIAMM